MQAMQILIEKGGERLYHTAMYGGGGVGAGGGGAPREAAAPPPNLNIGLKVQYCLFSTTGKAT